MNVTMPDGTVIENVPEGITQTELLRRFQLFKFPEGPELRAAPAGTLFGDEIAPGVTDFRLQPPGGTGQAEAQAEAILGEQPGIRGLELTQEGRPAALTTAAGLTIPGLGLVPAFLRAGAMEAATEFGERSIGTPPEEAREAGMRTAAGSLGGEGATAGLLATINRLAGPGASLAERRAVEGARRKGLPIPAPGRGRTALAGARGSIAGKLNARATMNRVIDFANEQADQLGQASPGAPVTAQRSARFIARELAEQTGRKDVAFTRFEDAIGKETLIPVTKTRIALREAADSIERMGLKGARVKAVIQIRDAAAVPDETLTVTELETLRKMRTTPQIHEAVTKVKDAIFDDYAAAGRELGIDPKALLGEANREFAALQELKKIPGIMGFSQVRGNPDKYVELLVQQPNAPLLDWLKKRSPGLHQELLAARLKLAFDSASEAAEGATRSVLDGNKLRQWYESNAPGIRRVYGKQQAQALDNFTRYLKQVYPESKTAARPLGVGEIIPRGGLSAGAGFAATGLGLPFAAGPIITEGGGLLLSRSLLNPFSPIFRIFERGGLEKGTQALLTRGAGLGGALSAQ